MHQLGQRLSKLAATLDKLLEILYKAREGLYFFHGCWSWPITETFYPGIRDLQSIWYDIEAKEGGGGTEKTILLELAIQL